MSDSQQQHLNPPSGQLNVSDEFLIIIDFKLEAQIK